MAKTKHASTQPDPIHAAIAAHSAAWQALTAAPCAALLKSGALRTHGDALFHLLSTPCATRVGAETLLRHLRICLAADPQRVDLGPCARVAHARAQDLALTLDADHEPAPRRLGEIVAAIVRRLRGAGEALAAAVIVIGGAFLIGAASLL